MAIEIEIGSDPEQLERQIRAASAIAAEFEDAVGVLVIVAEASSKPNTSCFMAMDPNADPDIVEAMLARTVQEYLRIRRDKAQ